MHVPCLLYYCLLSLCFDHELSIVNTPFIKYRRINFLLPFVPKDTKQKQSISNRLPDTRILQDYLHFCPNIKAKNKI